MRQLTHYRGALAAVADRALVSSANFAVAVIVAKSTSMGQYGMFVLMTTAMLFMSGLQNALILNPMRVLAVSTDPAEERRNTANQTYLQLALSAAVFCGVLACGPLSGLPFILLVIYASAVALFQLQEFVRVCLLTTSSMNQLLRLDGISQAVRLGLIGFAVSAGALDLGVIFAAMAVSFLFGFHILQEYLNEPHVQSLARTCAGNWTHARWLLMETVLYSLSIQAYLFIAAHLLGAEAAGGIGAIQNVFNAANVIQLGLIGYCTPIVRRHWLKGDKARWLRTVKRLGLLLLSVMGMLSIVMYWAGEAILATLYTPQFAEYRAIVPMLGAFYCLGAVNTVVNMAFRTADRPDIGFRAKSLSSMVALLAGFPVIEEMGIQGAAVGLALTQGIWTIAYALAFWKLRADFRI